MWESFVHDLSAPEALETHLLNLPAMTLALPLAKTIEGLGFYRLGGRPR